MASEDLDLGAALDALGIKEQVAGFIDETDAEAVGDLLDGDDYEEAVGALVARHAPELDTKARQKVSQLIGGHMGSLEKFFAGVLQVWQSNHSAPPNRIVTLYPYSQGGESLPGGTFKPGTIYPLHPRIGCVTQSTPLSVTKDMMILRVRAEPIDAATGWWIAANTVKFGDDEISVIRNDASFTVLRPEIPTDESPLVSIYKRVPKQNTTFQISAYLNASTSMGMPGGVTVEMIDSTCKSSSDVMNDGFGSLNFGELAGELLSTLRTRRIRRTAPTTTPKTVRLVPRKRR